MTTRKNTSSTIKATRGTEVLYLSTLDETHGLDIKLDLQGYALETI